MDYEELLEIDRPIEEVLRDRSRKERRSGLRDCDIPPELGSEGIGESLGGILEGVGDLLEGILGSLEGLDFDF